MSVCTDGGPYIVLVLVLVCADAVIIILIRSRLGCGPHEICFNDGTWGLTCYPTDIHQFNNRLCLFMVNDFFGVLCKVKHAVLVYYGGLVMRR